MSDSMLVAELRLPAEQIVAEAKRWSLAEDVGLQVLPTGAVRVMVQSARARQFVEHLVSLEPAGSSRAAPALAKTTTDEWERIVELARQIDREVASGSRVSGHLALRLARSVLALDEPIGDVQDARRDRE
jgi:hypothetical protein